MCGCVIWPYWGISVRSVHHFCLRSCGAHVALCSVCAAHNEKKHWVKDYCIRHLGEQKCACIHTNSSISISSLLLHTSPSLPCIPPSLPRSLSPPPSLLSLSLSLSLSLCSCSTVWQRRGLARRSSTWWAWCATTASTTPPSSSRPRYASGCTSTTPTSKRWDTVRRLHAATRGGGGVAVQYLLHLQLCLWEQQWQELRCTVSSSAAWSAGAAQDWLCL